jgi:peptide/nickel transport system permease protein
MQITILRNLAGCYIATVFILALVAPYNYAAQFRNPIMLPLNISPKTSIAPLAVVLAAAGCPSGTHVILAVVLGLRTTPAAVQARAYECGRVRLFGIHVLPRLRSPLAAQFRTLVPTFLSAEASLGVRGLSESLPSSGNLIAELRGCKRINEASWILIPAALLVSILTALQFLLSGSER